LEITRVPPAAKHLWKIGLNGRGITIISHLSGKFNGLENEMDEDRSQGVYG
jgi:hypothetical protein